MGTTKPNVAFIYSIVKSESNLMSTSLELIRVEERWGAFSINKKPPNLGGFFVINNLL